jgi:glycosyltransferase involved in cell wall biosynthesis
MTAPRVLVDVTAVPADRAGVGRYVDELLRALEIPVTIVCQRRDADYYRALAPGARVIPQSGIERSWVRLLWEQLRLPGIARRAGARVIHSPHYTIPLATRRSRVVTFHDATFFSDPGVHTPIKRVFFRTWIRVSRRLADAVIVPSAATAAALADYVPATDYRVIHHGVDSVVFAPPSADARGEVAARLGIDGSWIAFLGTIEPRKNLPELLRAYAALAREWDPADGALPQLALAGQPGWGPAIDAEVDAIRAPGIVRRLGYIDVDLLAAYLGGASVVAYPSLGEGFGLPVLEAMASGATVLTTRRLAIPEIGAGAVEYTEPDAPSIATALRALLRDPARRAELSQLALERSRSFSWASTAHGHAAVYDEVVG